MLLKHFTSFILMPRVLWTSVNSGLHSFPDGSLLSNACDQELRRNFKDSGYFRDKFHKWTASEAAMLCDNATRYQDHIHELLHLVPNKSLPEVAAMVLCVIGEIKREPWLAGWQVMDFYNHFLCNSSLQELCTASRLFQVLAASHLPIAAITLKHLTLGGRTCPQWCSN